jgi:hypothetical protein
MFFTVMTLYTIAPVWKIFPKLISFPWITESWAFALLAAIVMTTTAAK